MLCARVFLSSFLGFRIYIYFGVVAGGRCADNFDGDGVVFFFLLFTSTYLRQKRNEILMNINWPAGCVGVCCHSVIFKLFYSACGRGRLTGLVL